MAIRKRLLGFGLLGLHCGLAMAGDWTFPSAEPLVPFPDTLGSKAIIDTPDFEYLADYKHSDAIYQLGRKVAELVIDRRDSEGNMGRCTGFLVGPDLLLTNHHCVVYTTGSGKPLPGQDKKTVHVELLAPEKVVVHMEYYKRNELGPLGAHGAAYLALDERLDFALLRLDTRLGDRYGWLPLASSSAQLASQPPTVIIQHPSGRAKSVVTRDNQLVAVYPDEAVVHYRADTEPGSSGSPVLLAGGDTVVALHHAGIPNYNEGILMSAIYAVISPCLKVGAKDTRACPVPAWADALDLAEQGKRRGQQLILRADPPVQRIRDTVRFSLQIPRAGYLTLLSLDESGEGVALLPNQYHPNNRVEPGELTIPGGQFANFTLQAGGDTGQKLVLALLTDEPFALESSSKQGEVAAVFPPVARGLLESKPWQRQLESASFAYIGSVVTVINP